jgi:hypothetical protein
VRHILNLYGYVTRRHFTPRDRKLELGLSSLASVERQALSRNWPYRERLSTEERTHNFALPFPAALHINPNLKLLHALSPFRCLTFDMSGGFGLAQPARRRPLDGGVRPRGFDGHHCDFAPRICA